MFNNEPRKTVYVNGELRGAPVHTLAILVLKRGKPARIKRALRYWFQLSISRVGMRRCPHSGEMI